MAATNGRVHGRQTRVVVQGRDLSCDLRSASTSLSGSTVNGTGFCHGLMQYTRGLPDGSASLSGYFDSGWDGSHRGQKLNPAVFAYYAVIEFIDGQEILYEGDVTLKR